MLSPAVFVSVLNILRKENNYEYKKFQNYVVLTALVLSKSSTGYIGVLFTILIIGINLRRITYLLLFFIVGILSVVGLYNSVDEFKNRVDTTLGLVIDKRFTIDNVNTSSFVLLNNAHVAFENFKEYPIFGTGLGSHPLAYEKYSYTRTGLVNFQGTDNNSSDGNSMFVRLMSETGLVGLLFIFLILIKCFVGNIGTENHSWIISGALLVLIALNLFRQGNYFLNGFPFFVWLYFFNKVKFNEYLSKKE